MIPKILWLTGSAIFLILGTWHLWYTFFTTKFNPRNKPVIEEMKNTSPELTRRTTIWKAWIGFNGSHSAGAIFFGLILASAVLIIFLRDWGTSVVAGLVIPVTVLITFIVLKIIGESFNLMRARDT